LQFSGKKEAVRIWQKHTIVELLAMNAKSDVNASASIWAIRKRRKRIYNGRSIRDLINGVGL
jgi:hypothetical protein